MVRVLFLLLLLLLPHGVWAFSCDLKDGSPLAHEVLAELQKHPISCTKEPVHLTFDDGPNPAVTPVILKELKERNVKATFFITTTNLDSSHPESREDMALVREEMSQGHLVGDHGYEHNAYDLRLNANGSLLDAGMSEKEREDQIHRSVVLLNQATGNRFSQQSTLLFRLPYGRGAMPSPQELDYMERKGEVQLSKSDFATRLAEYREQSAPLQILSHAGFSHLGWNHDSGDSSFGMGMPSKEKLKSHILKNLKELCHSPFPVVALFHDIKMMNTEVIPAVIDIGRCLGIEFISPSEMLEHRKILSERGVLLGKQKISQGPVRTVAAALQSLPNKVSGEPTCDEKSEKSCFSSQLNRSYQRCEGGDSICLDGKWYSRRDPLIILNCNLPE